MTPIVFTICLLVGPASDNETAAWNSILESRRQIWSLQPVQNPPTPLINDRTWSAGPVDRFVLAQLEKAKLSPAAPADRRVLIRRLSIGLTGLLPSAYEVTHFIDDQSPNAYEKLVDRLLASPHFGERWARHWMDVVRFGETHGHEWNFEIRGAWRYRDYLIRAFNQDVPYDQLVLEHLAGDLLAEPRQNDHDQINESLIGTTFYRFGEVGHDNCLQFRELSLDVVDNQIDTIGKAFQAMTVACARCHDHKLDPVSMQDYYALNGILSSSRNVTRTIDLPTANHELLAKLELLKAEIHNELQAVWLEEATEVGLYLRAAQAMRDESTKSDQLAKVLEEDRVSHWTVALGVFDGEEPAAGDPSWEHPLYVWHSLLGNPSRDREDLGNQWPELFKKYDQERQERQAFNAENFVEFSDFRAGDIAPWHIEGLGLIRGSSPSGNLAIAWEGDSIIESVLPQGIVTNSLTNRLNGALRSPFLPKDKKFLSLQVAGSNSVIRTVFDNCHLGVTHTLVDNHEVKWFKVSTESQYPESKVYAEVVTKLDYQCYPELSKGKKIGAEDRRSSFAITQAVFHDCEETPRHELNHIGRLFSPTISPSTTTATVTSADAVLDRYAMAIEQAIKSQVNGSASEDDIRWLSWLLKHRLLTNSIDATPRLSELVASYREVEEQIPPPRIVYAVADLADGFHAPLRERGDPYVLGKVVKRRYVEVLSSSDQTIEGPRSGRLEVAQTIASEKNPLTARVMVNRLWHHAFGTGIVGTPDDFGSIGDRPSHPKLMDYLAWRFVKVDRWSVKNMIRSLVQSNTFRMSSVVSQRNQQTDPNNRWLHHYPLRRLEAEVIRDGILMVSGRLDRSLYGESIDPYRLKERAHRRLFSGPLDGAGRRSIYTKMTLSEEPPFLATFNQPEPKTTRGQRDITSGPAQALSLLNDPFVNQQADHWGQRLAASGTTSIRSRIEYMFQVALGRAPDRHETDQFEQFVQRLTQLHSVPKEELLVNTTIWRDTAHTVFNMKEFIYTR